MSARIAFWRREQEDALGEEHARPGLLSDFILGSQDGLVNVLGVILGIAIAAHQQFLAGRLADPFRIVGAGARAARRRARMTAAAILRAAPPARASRPLRTSRRPPA